MLFIALVLSAVVCWIIALVKHADPVVAGPVALLGAIYVGIALFGYWVVNFW